jgi:hypothetical protein
MVQPVIRVSSLGLCQRRVFYSHQPELQPVVTPESQRKMALGHLIETLRRRELRREGVRVYGPQKEVRFGPAVGHIDGWLKTPSGPVLFECKSTTSFSVNKWLKESLPRAISFQIHAYTRGLSDLLGERVNKTQLEVVDRSSGEVHSWLYDEDPFVTQAALERAESLAHAVETGQNPEQEFAAGSAECRYCPFANACRPELVPPEDVQGACADGESWPGFRNAIDLYNAGRDLQEEGESLVSQAKENLQQQLLDHNATKARANGSLVLWSQVETTRFDAKALQKEKPDLYAAFLKPSHYQRLEVRR